MGVEIAETVKKLLVRVVTACIIAAVCETLIPAGDRGGDGVSAAAKKVIVLALAAAVLAF